MGGGDRLIDQALQIPIKLYIMRMRGYQFSGEKPNASSALWKVARAMSGLLGIWRIRAGLWRSHRYNYTRQVWCGHILTSNSPVPLKSPTPSYSAPGPARADWSPPTQHTHSCDVTSVSSLLGGFSVCLIVIACLSGRGTSRKSTGFTPLRVPPHAQSKTVISGAVERAGEKREIGKRSPHAEEESRGGERRWEADSISSISLTLCLTTKGQPRTRREYKDTGERHGLRSLSAAEQRADGKCSLLNQQPKACLMSRGASRGLHFPAGLPSPEQAPALLAGQREKQFTSAAHEN